LSGKKLEICLSLFLHYKHQMAEDVSRGKRLQMYRLEEARTKIPEGLRLEAEKPEAKS